MKQMRNIGMFLLSFILCQGYAQNEVELLSSWEYEIEAGSSQKFNKIITAFDGSIIAVGEVSGSGKNERDGLFVIIDPNTGRKRDVFKKIGGPGDDVFNSVVQNYDGTFTLVGHRGGQGKDPQRAWVLRLDEKGERIDEHFLNGVAGEHEWVDIALTGDGLALVVGTAWTNRNRDILLLPIVRGKVQPHRKFGNEELNTVTAVTSTVDNNFILLGNTGRSNQLHESDIWAMKINESGLGKWSAARFFGGEGIQNGMDITRSKLEGGFVIIGANEQGANGKQDAWMIKIDENGRQEWEKYYGGYDDDQGTAVIELSEGGFAIAGQTKSHKPKASTSILNIILTDRKGNMIDSKIQSVFRGDEDNISNTIVELVNGEELVLSGSSAMKGSGPFTRGFVGAFSYRFRASASNLPTNGIEAKSLSMSTPIFYDEVDDQRLSVGERGYYYIEVKNNTAYNLHNIVGSVSADNSSTIRFADEVQLGTITAGQTKPMFIPVLADDQLSETVELKIDLKTAGQVVNSTIAKISAEKVLPPKIVVSGYTLTPEGPAKPGEVLKVELELTNTGGLSSPSIPARFVLPNGVTTNEKGSLQVPPIGAKETQRVPFYFQFDKTVKGNALSITFETQELANVSAIKKTLSVAIEKPAAITPKSDIFWVNPDPMEYTSNRILVKDAVVEIKVLAVSTTSLSKKNFSTIINGRRPEGQKMDEATLSFPTTREGRRQQSYRTKVRLKEGKNEVQVVYYQEDGKTISAESQKLIFDYVPKDKPNLYVLSIGVEHGDLKYTVKDAQDFAESYYGLKDNSGKGFKRVDVRQLLKKEETSKVNIQKAFLDLKNWGIKDGDLVVVFISSHGKILDNNKYLLLPSDFDSQYQEITAINFNNDILKPLRVIDGNKLVFIDACHSGMVGSRSFSDDAASKVMNDLIRSTSGIEIFASCRDGEFSYEDDSWENGAFTKAILEAFRNEEVTVGSLPVRADIFADNPVTSEREEGSDGVITIEELKIFLGQRVPFLAKKVKGKAQNPTNKSAEHLDKNTGIFMINQ